MKSKVKSQKSKVKNLLLTSYFLLLTSALFAKSLWLEGNEKSIFSDRKASLVGDVITVVIIESAKASDISSSKRDKNLELNVEKGIGPLKFIPKLGAKGESKYSRKGQTSKAGSIQAKVSASVIKVMPNGNLLIEGEKRVKIDQEEQVVYVSGIARPEDIDPENTILSTSLADCKIEYRGEVKFSSKERPNIGVRIFQKLFGWIF